MKKTYSQDNGLLVSQACVPVECVVEPIEVTPATVERAFQQPNRVKCECRDFQLIAEAAGSHVRISWNLSTEFKLDRCGSYLVGFREESDFALIGLSENAALTFNDGLQIVFTQIDECIEDGPLKNGTWCYTFVTRRPHVGRRELLRPHLGQRELLKINDMIEGCEWVRFKVKIREQRAEAKAVQLTRDEEDTPRVSPLAQSDGQRGAGGHQEQTTTGELLAALRQAQRTIQTMEQKSAGDGMLVRELNRKLVHAKDRIKVLQRELAIHIELLRGNYPRLGTEHHAQAWVAQGLTSIRTRQEWENIVAEYKQNPEFQALPENERQFFLEKERVQFFQSRTEESEDKD